MCFPMVPTCFLDDLISSLDYLLPKVFMVPSVLLTSECPVNFLEEQTLVYTTDCFKKCDEPPFLFNSWYQIMAWVAVELNADTWLADNIDWAYFGLPEGLILDSILVKQQQYMAADPDIIFANRICAVLQSYHILPWVLLFSLVLLTSAALVSLLMRTVVDVVVLLLNILASTLQD